VIAIGTDDKACKELGGQYKERLTTAVCDAKDMKQVGPVGGLSTAVDGLERGFELHSTLQRERLCCRGCGSPKICYHSTLG